MAEIKLTKSELRVQQNRLLQLQRYLPTLQLKKAMLQGEVLQARNEISALEEQYQKLYTALEGYSALLSVRTDVDMKQATHIAEVRKRYENIAGVEVPLFESVVFVPFTYSLFLSPPWLDTVIQALRELTVSHQKREVAIEKKVALEKELREVSIRVNLFEKILIPRAIKNIKKIKVFLGDQQLAAVSQAKVAKAKIIMRALSSLRETYAH